MGPRETKCRIKTLLESTKREGIAGMYNWLEVNGFFSAPASSKYHGCYDGGLAKHSLRVYNLLNEFYFEHKIFGSLVMPGQNPLPVTDNNLVIAALLHDVCKVGAYVKNTHGGKGYSWNKQQPKGHALLSIERIKKFIELEPIEEMMIKFHMGVYGLNEYEERTGEYPLRGDQTLSKEEKYGKSLANAWYHNPIVKLIYFADELATMEEKAE